MSQMIDLAIGRGCHFCGERNARNARVRREDAAGQVEDFATPLCVRHRLLLQAAGDSGRLHKASGVRWWLADDDGTPRPGGPSADACPASALLR
ncbi:MAG: hypothetical protein HYX51_02705 [Chloroflexi bacterium]|nr:hypothetical protein [Chloroflexota bacterium]